MKSTVMVRVSSGFSTDRRCSASAFWLPKPVMSHSTSYSGTSAKPNAKLPSAKRQSFSVSFLFCVHYERATDMTMNAT